MCSIKKLDDHMFAVEKKRPLNLMNFKSLSFIYHIWIWNEIFGILRNSTLIQVMVVRVLGETMFSKFGRNAVEFTFGFDIERRTMTAEWVIVVTKREDEGAGGLAALGENGEGRQGGHQVVFGDGVEEARTRDEALQAGAARGQERADEDGPLVGPGDVGHHQSVADALAEPALLLRFSYQGSPLFGLAAPTGLSPFLSSSSHYSLPFTLSPLCYNNYGS